MARDCGITLSRRLLGETSVGNSIPAHTHKEDCDPGEANVVEGNGPVVGVEPLGLAGVEVLVPVDAVRLRGKVNL